MSSRVSGKQRKNYHLSNLKTELRNSEIKDPREISENQNAVPINVRKDASSLDHDNIGEELARENSKSEFLNNNFWQNAVNEMSRLYERRTGKEISEKSVIEHTFGLMERRKLYQEFPGETLTKICDNGIRWHDAGTVGKKLSKNE